MTHMTHRLQILVGNPMGCLIRKGKCDDFLITSLCFSSTFAVPLPQTKCSKKEKRKKSPLLGSSWSSRPDKHEPESLCFSEITNYITLCLGSKRSWAESKTSEMFVTPCITEWNWKLCAVSHLRGFLQFVMGERHKCSCGFVLFTWPSLCSRGKSKNFLVAHTITTKVMRLHLTLPGLHLAVSSVTLSDLLCQPHWVHLRWAQHIRRNEQWDNGRM